MVKRFSADILRTRIFFYSSFCDSMKNSTPQGCVGGKFTSQWDDKSSRQGTATLEPMTIFLPSSQDEKGGSRLPYLEDLLLRSRSSFSATKDYPGSGHDVEVQDIFYDGIDVAANMHGEPVIGSAIGPLPVGGIPFSAFSSVPKMLLRVRAFAHYSPNST